jgi:transposase
LFEKGKSTALDGRVVAGSKVVGEERMLGEQCKPQGVEGVADEGDDHDLWRDEESAQKMAHASHQEVLVDYLNEVKRAKERIERLEKSSDEGIVRAPKHLQELIGALQTLRGVAKIGAATLVTEVGRFTRFESARQLMAYVGVVPSEHSSGGSTHRGSISKTGNARMRQPSNIRVINRRVALRPLTARLIPSQKKRETRTLRLDGSLHIRSVTTARVERQRAARSIRLASEHV